MKAESWQEIKSFLDSRGKSLLQFTETQDYYYIQCIDGSFFLEFDLWKDTSDSDTLNDFEQNYKPYGNKNLYPRDSDNSPLNRTKITRSGWHYQIHNIELETSRLEISHSKDENGNDLNFCSMKCFDSTGSEITQESNLGNCVKTILSWEPTHDYEILGAFLYQGSKPNSDVRIWTIGVPDISYPNGGSRIFVQGGLNLKFLPIQNPFKVDGRVPKYMAYDKDQHTNKFDLIVTHPAGINHQMMLAFEIFKP